MSDVRATETQATRRATIEEIPAMTDTRWGYRPHDSAVVVLCDSEQAARRHAVDGATAVVHRDGRWVGLPAEPPETPDRD